MTIAKVVHFCQITQIFISNTFFTQKILIVYNTNKYICIITKLPKLEYTISFMSIIISKNYAKIMFMIAITSAVLTFYYSSFYVLLSSS